MNKKIIYTIFSLFFSFVVLSCESGNTYDLKDNIYAEKHKIYTTKDTVYTGVTVLYTKINGHDAIYHIYSGKNKSQMEVWHFENECSKCKKGKK
jgi:hypothetical protein